MPYVQKYFDYITCIFIRSSYGVIALIFVILVRIVLYFNDADEYELLHSEDI